MPTFSSTLEETLHQAIRFAKDRRHEYVTLEHLLMALVEDSDASQVMQACNVDLGELKDNITSFLDETLAHLVTSGEEDAKPTPSFTRVIQRAAIHVQSAGRDEVTGANVLVALFAERESHAVFFLLEQEMSRYDAVRYISHGIKKMADIDPSEHFAQEAEQVAKNPSFDEATSHSGREGKAEALATYCTNLNEKAKKNAIDPLIGREKEVERAAQILCRRRKNNPLFVGDPGVGKTAIAEGLALKITRQEVPEVLHDAVIYSLDMGVLLAGTRYRGDFEERMKQVLKEIEKHPHAILFIDEIHTIIGAGSTSGGAMDASNLLKPALQSGKLRCMGSTTYKEFQQFFEKDRALTRRFQKIDVNEPTNEETIKILNGLKIYFEEHHQIRYTSEALKSAVELSARYMHDKRMPDKAIDVIDEAGASQMLLSQSKRKKTIGPKEIEAVIASMARIPAKTVSKDDTAILKNLDGKIKNAIYGQDDAVDALATSIKMSRAGLREPEKPIGCYLFAGPTGVGKTEVTRELSKQLGLELVRFDMSEYMERHAVSRLIGAPPGYVGYEQGGLMTDAIDQNPHCILLLDEIEKAHPDLFNLLLQVMDHGKLTDNNGKKIDFRNVILIMTTNCGAAEMEKNAIGFGSFDHGGNEDEAIKRAFSPEFRNRLDSVIYFSHLTQDTVMQVVHKFIIKLEDQLSEKNVSISLSDDATRWLADKGYDKAMGARPLSRLIQEKIKKPLADELLFGKLNKGGSVSVAVDKKTNELKMIYEPSAARKAVKKSSSKSQTAKSKTISVAQ
ncbi:MAG: ATP-dependent Clp protease ATP-binding subunit ClpA [Pseudomonadota bacterium]